MPQDEVQEKFLEWVLLNQEAITSGGAVFEGQTVTPESEGVRFETCCSILILTLRKKTPMFLSGSKQATQSQFIATFVSLLLGWWGVPFGVIFTPLVVANNLWGGEKTKVANILEAVNHPDGLKSLKKGGIEKVMVTFILGVLGIIIILALIFKIYALIKNAF